MKYARSALIFRLAGIQIGQLVCHHLRPSNEFTKRVALLLVSFQSHTIGSGRLSVIILVQGTSLKPLSEQVAFAPTGCPLIRQGGMHNSRPNGGSSIHAALSTAEPQTKRENRIAQRRISQMSTGK
jgi:hypothetical protein